MYLAKKTSIDFVAHHEIQLQSCQGVYEELGKTHKCSLLIGQDCKPTGAEAAVLLDHCAFQANVTKDHYKYIIHMSHDLADWDVYVAEKKTLVKFDLLLVPGSIHYENAVRNIGSVPTFKIGWPKLEAAIDIFNSATAFNQEGQKTIIYAPSFINNREWEELLPALIDTGHKIIIKNHVYYDFENGAAPPKGSEGEYATHIDSLLAMEAYVAKANAANVEYIDRRFNLCLLFPTAHLLITDSSSASMEFLSFGLSIETGRYGPGVHESKPFNSLITNKIKYIPLHKLLSLLKEGDNLSNMIDDGAHDAKAFGNPFIFSPTVGASKHAAAIIDLFLYLKQNSYRLLRETNNVSLWNLHKWL